MSRYDNLTARILNAPRPKTFQVRLKEDDRAFGLRAGDILEVHPYVLDPDTKFTVVQRLSDGFDPECNVYRTQVERL